MSDSTDYSTRSLPEGVSPVGRLALTRRRFVSGAVKVGVSVAAVTGGVVGFAPSAQAANCIPGTKHGFAKCNTAYIGRCNTHFSSCKYYAGTRNLNFTCNCTLYCSPAKAFCKCINEGDFFTGYGCCVYC
jgi:hypothetical protein